jgi:hypothetical protein
MEPCPLEGRRSSKELAYSLVFVSLTTMAACAHLEHALRRNKSPAAILGRLLLVQCCPIFPIYELSESLAVTVYQWLFPRAGPWREINSAARHANASHNPTFPNVRLFLAQANGAHVSPDDESTTSRPLTKTGPAIAVWKREAHIVVRGGQLVVICTGLVPCLGTLIKQIRRLNHAPHARAMMLADLRIFWLTLAMIVVLFQSLVLILVDQEYSLDRLPAVRSTESIGLPWGATARYTILSSVLILTGEALNTEFWATAGFCFNLYARVFLSLLLSPARVHLGFLHKCRADSS